MEFKLNHFHRNTPDTDLIVDLKRVANKLGKSTVTIEEYNQYGTFHSTTLTRRFGSWFTCLTKADLAPSRSLIGIPDEDLFADIERVWIQVGKQPTYRQMSDLGVYSIGTYENRFGGWTKSLEAFVNYINRDEWDQPSTLLVNSIGVEKNIERKSSRKVNLSLRFKVLSRDCFKCCACGQSPATNPSVELHVDHIIPWSRGGETEVSNLQTLCSKCNLGKSDLII